MTPFLRSIGTQVYSCSIAAQTYYFTGNIDIFLDMIAMHMKHGDVTMSQIDPRRPVKDSEATKLPKSATEGIERAGITKPISTPKLPKSVTKALSKREPLRQPKPNPYTLARMAESGGEQI